MLLSRTKPDIAASSSHGTSDSIGSSVGDGKVPSQEEFLSRRDFNGALALLEFQRNAGKNSLETDLWIAYCAFHLGNYKQAAEEYNKVLKRKNTSKECWTYLACCQFYMGLYQEAENSAAKGAAGDLQNRLLFHLAHKAGDEAKLMSHHQQLQDILADQLSLASVHYLRRYPYTRLKIFFATYYNSVCYYYLCNI